MPKKEPQTRFLNKKFLFLSGIFLCLSFFAFTFWVRSDSLRPFDFNTTVKLQDKVSEKFDPYFSILSVVGRFEFTAPLLLILLLIKRKITGLIPIFLFGTAHIVELIGKTILEQPGPPNMFLRSQFSDFPGLYVHTQASYPSGHSLRAVFLAVIFIFAIYRSKLPKNIKRFSNIAILTILFFMLVSRVSLGEHWTTDVIGGSILGLSFSLLSLIFI